MGYPNNEWFAYGIALFMTGVAATPIVKRWVSTIWMVTATLMILVGLAV